MKKQILQEVIKDIKPTKEEEKEFSTRINSVLNKIKLKNAKAILGGSGVKQTWLKDAHDADIFVCFDYNKYKDKSSELANILEKALKKEFKITRLHGSRDYFQIKQKSFTFEIIPILNIKKADQAKNITDISPLHAKWVNNYKKLSDEMRLTMQFFKAASVYGAESYIKGFSGYVCEILTVYYKDFLNLIKNIAKWKEKTIIDAKHYFKNKEVLYTLNKSKIQSPLIVIDPVQKERNAAAALSKEKFDILVNKAKQFLKNPSKKFFEKEEFSIDTLKTKNKLIILDIKVKSGKRDIIGCKLLKAIDFIKKQLLKNDFKVLDYGWNWDESSNALFYFILKKETLSKNKIWQGPPLKAEPHLKAFKKKYKKTFVKNGKIYANVKREYINPEDLIKELIKNDYLKDKIKDIKLKNEK
jgi:tRNA nucleotidyltransferase (CCA-adding enzyme)